MQLESDIKKYGYWWLPNTPDKMVPGILTCSHQGRVSLETLGSLTEKPISQESSPPIILGVFEDGELITLIRCSYSGQTIGAGMTKWQIRARFMLRGTHLKQEEDLFFTRVTLRIVGLDEWVGVSGIEVDRNLTESKLSIDFKPPQPLEFDVSDKCKISLQYGWKGPTLYPVIFSASITQKTYLQLEFRDKMPLEELIRVVNRVSNFLRLATDSPVPLTEVLVATPAYTRKLGEKELLQNITVYYESMISNLKKRPFSHDMLFQFESIKSRFGDIVGQWLEEYKNLEPVFNQYFSLIYKEDQFLEIRFLSLIRGLETLHRRTGNNRTIPEEEHEERIRGILEATPEEHKDWLGGRLTYSYEPTLRFRIKELLKPFVDIFGNSKKRSSFIKNVINTRNYLTHFDKSLEDKVVTGIDLLDLITKLRTLFVLHFLKILEFDDTVIREIYAKNRNLSFD